MFTYVNMRIRCVYADVFCEKCVIGAICCESIGKNDGIELYY